jgi:hypothetical protein
MSFKFITLILLAYCIMMFDPTTSVAAVSAALRKMPSLSADGPTTQAGTDTSPPVTPAEDPEEAPTSDYNRSIESTTLSELANNALAVSKEAFNIAVRAKKSPFDVEEKFFLVEAVKALGASCSAVQAVRTETEQVRKQCEPSTIERVHKRHKSGHEDLRGIPHIATIGGIVEIGGTSRNVPHTWWSMSDDNIEDEFMSRFGLKFPS